MSAEALRYVWKNKGKTKGAKLLMLLALAELSSDRQEPFFVTAGGQQIADQINASPMAARQTLSNLLAGDYITLEERGGGRAVNTYRITL